MKWSEAGINVKNLKQHQEPNNAKLNNSTKGVVSIESYRRLHEFLLIYHTNYRHHLHQYFYGNYDRPGILLLNPTNPRQLLRFNLTKTYQGNTQCTINACKLMSKSHYSVL